MSRLGIEIFPDEEITDSLGDNRNAYYADLLKTLVDEMVANPMHGSFAIRDKNGCKVGEAEFIDD